MFSYGEVYFFVCLCVMNETFEDLVLDELEDWGQELETQEIKKSTELNQLKEK